ncbi:hypothetical protein FHS19_005134 [Paenibacillus rhizosphaerae]|uniref:Uncharacterized protein n=1 Tax=Paenibacillus rhizosphaerae TaxID=297318 RepID=A0A839TYY5_9BACL|nr:hypothetical protein [Paenibacillus rhizosphaerae]
MLLRRMFGIAVLAHHQVPIRLFGSCRCGARCVCPHQEDKGSRQVNHGAAHYYNCLTIVRPGLTLALGLHRI